MRDIIVVSQMAFIGGEGLYCEISNQSFGCVILLAASELDEPLEIDESGD